MDLCNGNDIKALLARHGFRFSKSMGQNFLIEGWVPRDIAEASGADSGCGVLEIGPGIGPLTVQLARRAGQVAAVELDRAALAGDWAGLTPHLWWVLAYAAAALAAAVLLFLRQMKKQ